MQRATSFHTHTRGILSEIAALSDENPIPGNESLSNAEADLFCSERACQSLMS